MPILSDNPSKDNCVPANNADALWPQVLETLRGQMTKSTFDSLLAGSRAELRGAVLTIYPRSEMARQWLENRWLERIAQAVAAAVGRPVALELKPALEARAVYLPLEELLEQEPDEPDEPDAEFQGVYHDHRNAIIQPQRVELHTQYFRKRWRPLLGPLLSELVRELRQRCHFKSGRNTFKTTYKNLAQALGVSERTIKRALERDASGNFKNAYLGYFIDDLQTLYQSDGKSIRNLGTRFVIYLDEPLTPDDQAKIRKGQNGT